MQTSHRRIGTGLVAASAIVFAFGCGAPPRPRLEGSLLRVSEVHFDPSSEQGRAEFVEVANLGSAAADLSGWNVTGPGRIALPAGTKLAPQAVLVVAKEKAACEKLAGRSLEIAATFVGKLRGKGETIRLEDPEGRVADEVSYDPVDQEVAKAQGTGLSIHRASVDASGEPGKTWKAGPPTPGRLK